MKNERKKLNEFNNFHVKKIRKENEGEKEIQH